MLSEAQVVETQTEAKKKPVERLAFFSDSIKIAFYIGWVLDYCFGLFRKKSTSDEPKAKRLRKAKDDSKKKSSSSSNKPKRPLTAFFIFM